MVRGTYTLISIFKSFIVFEAILPYFHAISTKMRAVLTKFTSTKKKMSDFGLNITMPLVYTYWANIFRLFQQ